MNVLKTTLLGVTAALQVQAGTLQIPVTPFSNMASGYQATNPGFRAFIKTKSGALVAGGKLTIDAVISGYSDDASAGSPYGKLVLNLDNVEFGSGLTNPFSDELRQGQLTICMAQDPEASIAATTCRNLTGNLHPERPFQIFNHPVEFKIQEGNVKITRYLGKTGEGGTSQQIALAVFHPAYGFTAPGKAFKDYQSPLVLDLNNDGKLSLINVWNKAREVHFDFDGMGEKVQTGWINAGEGLLFWDDGSGCVHNGTQLYGEFFGSKGGVKTHANGFEALAKQLDPNHTGRVIAKDHPNLKIWRNWGTDGVCRTTEVYPASQFVKEIALGFREFKDVKLNEDNEVRAVGSFTGADGKKKLIADVWFKQVRKGNVQVTSVPETPRSMHVTNRRPLQMATTHALKTYADSNNFYLSIHLEDGMKVSYSASYGMGGEAGQAYGVLVEDNGHFWFKQINNPTSQLLLPPGLTADAINKHSLWDLREYTELVNRVAYSTKNSSSTTENDVYGAPKASLVDFNGGTAGVNVSYKDAMEVVFNRTVGTRSKSNLAVYYAKGVGPVALEFSEDIMPSGTFKVYLGK